MTTNITTLTQKIIGRGHVVEDENPTPTRFRKKGPQPDEKKADDTAVNQTIKHKGE